jgi:LysR family hydrogen peroxide-inducible transcriptional activator
MNLRDLQYLVALADHRHFGRAAEACFVSQPTLSTQVKKLETELGAELLERSPRAVLLTAVGEQVVAHARTVLDEADAIRGVARHAQDPRAGQLRLGAFPTIAPYLFPHVVPTLRDRLPDLELLLTEEKSAVLIEQLRTGRLDAAVLALPVDDDTLHPELLFREDFVLAVPANHPLAVGASDGSEQAPISIDVLHDERVLLLTEGHCLRDQALAVCQLAGVGERDGFRATSLETLRNMVAAGAGVTLLPLLAVRPPVAPSPAIALRAFRDPAPHRDIALVWRRTSVFRDMLPEIAHVLRTVPGDVVHPL